MSIGWLVIGKALYMKVADTGIVAMFAQSNFSVASNTSYIATCKKYNLANYNLYKYIYGKSFGAVCSVVDSP